MTDRRCDRCTAYEPWDGGVGRCHFMPPIGVRDARNEMWTPFPIVEPQWWCAQFEERPVAPPRDNITYQPADLAPFEDEF